MAEDREGAERLAIGIETINFLTSINKILVHWAENVFGFIES